MASVTLPFTRFWAPEGKGQIVVLDNRDSFVYNLAHRFFELGQRVAIVRSDSVGVDELEAMRPSALVLSPGPGHPLDAGVSVEAIARLSAQIPILGVCLGHQAIATAFGGRVVPGGRPVHGKASLIEHDGSGVLEGLSQPLEVGRYHSLIVEEPLPDALRITARADGFVMGLQHREHPTFGIQFHPESVLTPSGYHLLENFLRFIR